MIADASDEAIKANDIERAIGHLAQARRPSRRGTMFNRRSSGWSAAVAAEPVGCMKAPHARRLPMLPLCLRVQK